MTAQRIRILVVDDNVDILRDFEKILGARSRGKDLAVLEQELFGDAAPVPSEGPRYELSFAESGEQAVLMARQAVEAKNPFTMAFVDMRMPGWDGLQTIEQLWRVQPELQVAISSAYMDYSWQEVIHRLQRPGLRLIRKPWTGGEVLGIVHELHGRAKGNRQG